ncbi:MAG: leucine-rich repeat domain-containing protein [Promethearchaeota archaeon]
MQEFKINDFLTLKLENNKTIIYVTGERFIQCKSLILDISVDEMKSIHKIESIDEIAEKLNKKIEIKTTIEEPKLSPEAIFWGHCSNLQVWVEHEYDTRLLHSNLAFPLLKKLSEAGDPQAKKTFKKEILKRLNSEYLPILMYLINRNYLDYFTMEELKALLYDFDSPLFKIIVKAIEMVNRKNFLSLIDIFKNIKKIFPEFYERIVDYYIEEGLKEAQIKYFLSSILRDPEGIFDKQYYLVYNKFLLKIFKYFKEKIVVIALLEKINEYVKEFNNLIEVFSKMDNVPSIKLIDILGKILIRIQSNDEENFHDVIYALKKHLNLLYRAISKGYYSIDLISQIDRFTNFLEIFWIYINIVPYLVDDLVEAELSKYGGDDDDWEYDDHWEKALALILEHDIKIEIKNDILSIIYDDKYTDDRDKELIDNFNQQTPKFELNTELVFQDNAFEEDWLRKYIEKYHTENFYNNWLLLTYKWKNKDKTFDQDINKIINFKGAQIPKIEAKILEDFESLSNKSIGKLEKIEIKRSGDLFSRRYNLYSYEDIYSYGYNGFTVKDNHVIEIVFNNSGLISLPENIGELTHLKILSIENNKLEKLPESLGNLLNMELLNLSRNKIKNIPKSLGNLKSVKYLDLGVNEIRILPENLKNLENLEYLDLTRNKIEIFPKILCNFSKLEVFHLGGNKFNLLPENIGNLKNLKELSVSQNKIKILPSSFKNLNNLKILRVNNTEFTNIPKEISEIISLEQLLFNGPNGFKERGFIEEIKGLERLVNLKILQLNNNKIKEIKGLDSNLKLKELNLSYNEIGELKDLENLVELEVLKLDHNRITEIKNLENNINLHSLNLEYNNIREINGLNSLKNLNGLYLTNNKIEELKGLSNLNNLRYLTIRGNKIDGIIYQLGGFNSDYVADIKKVLEYCKKKKEE